MTRAKWKLVVDIFEPTVGRAYPVVRHEFYGRTKRECSGYFEAHIGTDAFLRECLDKSRWKNVECTTLAEWVRLG